TSAYSIKSCAQKIISATCSPNATKLAGYPQQDRQVVEFHHRADAGHEQIALDLAGANILSREVVPGVLVRTYEGPLRCASSPPPSIGPFTIRVLTGVGRLRSNQFQPASP